MLHLNISLTSLAAILWSGMLIIAGSIWVLSSQVRKLADLLEQQGKAGVRSTRVGRDGPGGSSTLGASREYARRSTGRATSRVR